MLLFIANTKQQPTHSSSKKSIPALVFGCDIQNRDKVKSVLV